MNGTIRVGSKRKNSKGKPLPNESIVHIDRTNPILGNKHILHNPNDNQERERVIRAFETDLIEDVKIKGPMYRAICTLAERAKEGENLILMCWCFPEHACHGNVIKQSIEQMLFISPTME